MTNTEFRKTLIPSEVRKETGYERNTQVVQQYWIFKWVSTLLSCCVIHMWATCIFHLLHMLHANFKIIYLIQYGK